MNYHYIKNNHKLEINIYFNLNKLFKKFKLKYHNLKKTMKIFISK